MTSSFGKSEPDLQADRTKQEFNTASSGYVPPPAGREATEPPKNPEQVLKPENITEQQAQAAAGLSSQSAPESSISLENQTQHELGLDQGHDLGLGL